MCASSSHGANPLLLRTGGQRGAYSTLCAGPPHNTTLDGEPMGSNVESPKHLEPPLDGTPFVVECIKQSWPGLSISDRAYLLAVLLADRSNKHKAIYGLLSAAPYVEGVR